ncbi:MAG: hypothetical protein R8F63_12175 [Acidimicrobiales bacterium]|nr:hypothetical protein [Acidimicrobiales bacterium]
MHTRRTTRPTSIVGVAVIAIIAAVTLALVASGSASGDTDPAAGASADQATDDLQALLTDVDPIAVAVFTSHAPEVERPDWCDELASHHDDWEGFLASIRAQTDAWATDEVGLLAQVGVAMAATCPADVDAFIGSVG